MIQDILIDSCFISCCNFSMPLGGEFGVSLLYHLSHPLYYGVSNKSGVTGK